MKDKIFGVVGLGRFGYHIAKSLSDSGAEVIACDIDEEKVNEISDFVTQSFILDATNEKALKESGLLDADTVIVSIGENIEASILVIVQLINLGVKEIIGKAINPQHGKVLEKLGVNRIVYPERDMAIRVAHSLSIEGVVEEIPFSKGYSIFEIKCPRNFTGKTLLEINPRVRFNINILAIKKGENIIVNPSKDEIINETDTILVLGNEESLAKVTG